MALGNIFSQLCSLMIIEYSANEWLSVDYLQKNIVPLAAIIIAF